MTQPTASRIDQLIALREKETNRRDEQVHFDYIDLIDAVLNEVPAGERNDVDLLLGRSCAVLPERSTKRVIMVQHADGAIEVATEFAPLRWNPEARQMESMYGMDNIVPERDAQYSAEMQAYGAELEDTPLDWKALRGDTAL